MIRALLLALALLLPGAARAQIGTTPGVGLATPSVLSFLQGTCQSHTSITIGVGTFAFVVPAGLGFPAGSFVTAAASGGSLLGFVQGYAGTNLTVKVVSGNAVGSGSFNCWNFTAVPGGPGDIVSSWAGWWGLRGFRNSSAGAAAANVCIVSTATCADVHVAANMTLVLSDLTSLNCGSNTCVFAKFYDQSGNGRDQLLDGVVASGDGQQFQLGCLGAASTLACAAYRTVGGTWRKAYATAAAITIAQPVSVSIVAMRTGSTSSRGIPLGSFAAANAPQLGFQNAASTAVFASPNAVTAPSVFEASWHAMVAVANSTSSSFNVDGSAIGGVPTQSSGWNGQRACLFGTNSASGACDNLHFFGSFAEGGIVASGLISADQTNLINNQRGFWGF